MGRRNLDRYRPDDWRAAAPTVRTAIDNRWRVFTESEVCELRIVADRRRIAEVKGQNHRLWGQTARCRRMGCPGKVVFHAQPPGAGTTIVMT
ncbi:hypothetical protein [Brevundimonas sp.]|jgi:hypothetical protein|uniref:hypothetical protein n=1 Tax=Brevundimonas sp. TaxID=1871086 RepID=UPI00391C4985